ncbi:MAG: NgoFVII family restriction endonuclease [Acidobacteria bacterium]|nr:NgoFVII family restriction endonuclease [Acidobacteriota bacterium]
MSIKLICHTKESAEGEQSPFDTAIARLARGNDISIACPYLNLQYIQSLIARCKSWRILTDVGEWISSHNQDMRKDIRDFIAENLSRIRHYPDLHAKIFIAKDSALVGSANFTKRGMTERAEMCVLFEKEDQVDELQEWFNDLWQQSVSIDVGVLSQYIESALPKPVVKPSLSLSSKMKKIKASWSLSDHKKSKVVSIKDKNAHQRLVERVSLFPSKEWVNEYFNLIKELIEPNGIEPLGIDESDKRLAMTLRKNSSKIMVNFNLRLVLSANANGRVHFIFRAEELGDDKFYNKIGDNWGIFTPQTGENEEEVPFTAWFEKMPSKALNQTEKRKWLQASHDEWRRRKGSPHRQYHEPLVYQATTDLDYRALVLEQAFPAKS